MSPERDLATKDQPDPSVRGVRVRVDLHSLVGLARPGGLPGPVLRLERDLAELRAAREQAPPDLVDEVLDRAAVEFVEDAVHEVADLELGGTQELRIGLGGEQFRHLAELAFGGREGLLGEDLGTVLLLRGQIGSTFTQALP